MIQQCNVQQLEDVPPSRIWQHRTSRGRWKQQCRNPKLLLPVLVMIMAIYRYVQSDSKDDSYNYHYYGCTKWMCASRDISPTMPNIGFMPWPHPTMDNILRRWVKIHRMNGMTGVPPPSDRTNLQFLCSRRQHAITMEIELPSSYVSHTPLHHITSLSTMMTLVLAGSKGCPYDVWSQNTDVINRCNANIW